MADDVLIPTTDPLATTRSDLRAWVAHRDPAAFQRLVERHAGMVHATCRRILGSDAGADEATQGAFIVLARSAAKVAPERLGPWLHAVAMRTAAALARAERRRRRHEAEAAMIPRPDAADAGWAEVRPHLDAALRALPAATRHAIVSHYLAGRPHAEVAAELGISVEAVRQRVSWALKRLRETLGRRGVAVSSALLLAGLAQEASAASPMLVSACVAAGMQPAGTAAAVAAGVGGGGAKLAVAAALALACVGAIGAAVLMARSAPVPPPAAVPAVVAATAPAEPSPAPAPVLPEVEPIAPDDPTPVGAWCVLGRLRFLGARAFTADELIAGLRRDERMLLAAHPRAARGAFAATLADRIAAGYRGAGHAAVAVRVGLRAGEPTVAIMEGPRCVAGTVTVTGASLPTVGLVAALADPRAKVTPLLNPVTTWGWDASLGDASAAAQRSPAKALWSPGSPPDTAPENLRRIEAAATAWYEQQGRLGARATASATVEGDRVALRLALDDEGRQGAITEIAWEGLRRSPTAALERDIGIRPGMPVDADLCWRILAWLQGTGRFITRKIAVQPTPGGVRLVITAVEGTTLPPYPEPFSPADEAVLRFGRWLARTLDAGEETLVADYVGDAARTCSVAQDRHGIAVTWSCDGRSGSLVASPGATALSVPADGVALTVPAMLPRALVGVSWKDGGEHDQAELSLAFSVGSGEPSPATIRPEAVLVLVRRAGLAIELADGRLWLRSPNVTWEIDAAEGRLIAAEGALPFGRWRMHVERDGVARRRAALPPVPAMALPDGVPSFGRVILLHGAAALEAGSDPALGAVAQRLRTAEPLLSGVLLPALAAAGAGLDTGDEDAPRFAIPGTIATDTASPLMRMSAMFCGHLADGLLDDLPHDRWPTVVLRAGQALLAGRADWLRADVDALLASPAFGPLGHLVTARLLAFVDAGAARAVAAHGRRRLDAEALLADAAMLAPVLERVVREAERQPEALGGLAAFGCDDDTIATARAVVTDAERTTREKVEALAMLLWNRGLRAELDRQLQGLVGPAALRIGAGRDF